MPSPLLVTMKILFDLRRVISIFFVKKTFYEVKKYFNRSCCNYNLFKCKDFVILILGLFYIVGYK